MKKSLRILSLLLALVFLLSLASMAAFADGEDVGELTEEELLRLQQEEEEERRRREEQEAAAAAARQLQAAPAPAAAPVVSVPAPGGQTVIPAGTTVDEVTSGEAIGTNNGTVTTNNGIIDTNNGTVTTNEGGIGNNKGKVTTNEAGGIIGTNTGTVTTNEGGIGNNIGTVTTNEAGGQINFNGGTVTTNNGTVTTNEETGKIDTNNGTVETNKGQIDTNNGTVTNNNAGGEIEFNTGTVNGGTVKYNAGGTVNGGRVENDGYGLNLNNFLGSTDRTFYGTGVVANSDKTAAFVPKKTSDLAVVFDHQDGYDMNVENGGVGYSAVYNAGVWIVSFDKVVNNLKIFFSKAIERKPTLDEQYMDFINSVVRKIREAEKNSTVEIDAGYWLSYRTEVFQALADRPDVSLRTTYRRDGKIMRFTIPAGTDVLTAVYPEVVVEFPKLAQLLHITPEQVK